jgi:hypothetical protein
MHHLKYVQSPKYIITGLAGLVLHQTLQVAEGCAVACSLTLSYLVVTLFRLSKKRDKNKQRKEYY